MIYESFPLSEIDLSNLVLVKEVIKRFGEQDHSRWIFRSPGYLRAAGAADLYLKIWNPTYIRHENILRGIESGFYDQQTTPGLVGLIYHRGLCRGYITRRCSYHRMIPTEFQQLIQAKTIQTGLFFVQYSRYHIMRYQKKFTLIDLEGIYPLEALPQMRKYHTVFDDSDYASFVYQMYRDCFPNTNLKLTELLLHPDQHERQAPPIARGLRFTRRKVIAAYKHLNTWRLATWGLRKDHLFLIEI